MTVTQQRNPHNPEKCPFYIESTSPLTAEESIARCVMCVTRGNQRLQSLKKDLHQTAYLTILEQMSEYDQDHRSGASFITFIRSKVCGKLWTERAEHLKSIPFPVHEGRGDTQPLTNNPLVDALVAEACQGENVDDRVTRRVEVKQFKKLLPQLLGRLSERERLVLNMNGERSLHTSLTATTPPTCGCLHPNLSGSMKGPLTSCFALSFYMSPDNNYAHPSIR